MGRLWSTLAGAVTSAVDGFDRWQRRRPATAVPSAVVRKYSDDRAGQLAGQISYAAFLAVFPMLLVLLTLVGVFLHGHRALQDEIINAALRQFPVLGTDVRANIHQLSASNVVVVVVGTLWLLYGATKLSRASQVMMASVWDIDRDDLPDFWHWIPRAAGFLVVLGVGFIAGGALAGLGAFGRLGVFSTWIGFILSLVVNVLMYWGGFAIVVHIPRNERAVWPGAVIGGGVDAAAVRRGPAGQPPAAPPDHPVWNLRHRPRPHLVDRPRRHDHRLRRRGQRGLDPPPLAPLPPATPATRRRRAGRRRPGGARHDCSRGGGPARAAPGRCGRPGRLSWHPGEAPVRASDGHGGHRGLAVGGQGHRTDVGVLGHRDGPQPRMGRRGPQSLMQAGGEPP